MKLLSPIIALVALLFGSVALAQDRFGHDPKACAPSERKAPDTHSDMRPDARESEPPATTGQSLSERLARTDGVLCPPDVDPEIVEQPPQTGRTPVIPPPGSPGGDPSIRPK